jgi:hypothetical protein
MSLRDLWGCKKRSNIASHQNAQERRGEGAEMYWKDPVTKTVSQVWQENKPTLARLRESH